MAQPYERVTAMVAERTGVHTLADGEATELLALARAVARASDDRRAAPLVCYLAGQLAASEFSAGERAARIAEVAALFPAEE